MKKNKKQKKAWLGALLVLIFGPFGFLYYSWKKAAIIFALFFLPRLLLYNLDYDPLAEVFLLLILLGLTVYAYFDINRKVEKLEKLLSSVITTSIIPIIILNFTAGIIGGIWLLFLGQWRLVLAGIGFSIFVPFIYSIVLLLQMPITKLMLYAFSKSKKIFGLTLAFINTFIGHISILAYVVLVVGATITLSETLALPIVSLLFFGYAIATSPFTYMAKGEPNDSIGSNVAVYIAQISYILFAIFYIIGHPSIAFPIILMIIFGFEFFLLKAGSAMLQITKK